MPLSRRDRVICARTENVPALDASRLLQSVLESFRSATAKVGEQMLNTLCVTEGPVMGMAKALRNEWKVSEVAASRMQEVFHLLRPSGARGVTAMFARTVSAHKWQRWYIKLGLKLRSALVSVLEAADASARVWMSTPSLVEWPVDLSRAGRLRKCAEPSWLVARLVLIAPCASYVGFGQQ